MSDQTDPADKYDKMVSAALERLTRWAFPDSLIERKNKLTWQLWHMTDNNEKYVDVEVELRMKKNKPDFFNITICATTKSRSVARRFG